MAENEELKSMPDPNQIGQSNAEPEQIKTTSTKPSLPEGSALDPNMKVVKNYVRKEEATDSKQSIEGTQKCPNCKQNISKSDWRQHFKICIMDSKWKEEKQKLNERQANAAYAGADDITQNLRRFASARPDIFGQQQAEQSEK